MLTGAARTEPAPTAIAVALGRLIGVLDEENAVLRQNTITAHTGFTDRKNHALRELMMLRRTMDQRTTAAHRDLLVQLNKAASENARLLKLHIAAVGEVSDIIIAGLRGASSDGTYTRSSAAYSRR